MLSVLSVSVRNIVFDDVLGDIYYVITYVAEPMALFVSILFAHLVFNPVDDIFLLGVY